MSEFKTSWIMEVVDNASKAMGDIGVKAGEMADTIEGAAKRSQISLKDVAGGVSKVATGAWGLYSAYDRYDDATLRTQKADNKLADAQERVTFRQNDLNDAIAKYGPNSDQAAEAATRLRMAQEDLTLADATARESHETLNETMISSGLIAIPCAATAFSGLKATALAVAPAFEGVTAAGAASAAGMAGLVGAGAAVVGTMAGLGLSISETKEQTGDYYSATDAVIGRMQDFPPVVKDVCEFLAKATAGWLTAGEKIKEGFEGIATKVSELAGNIKKGFDKAVEGIKAAWDSTVESIRTAVGKVISAAESVVGPVSEAWNGLVRSASEIWSGIIRTVSEAVSSIIRTITTGFSGVIRAVQDIFGSIYNICASAMDSAARYIRGVIDGIIAYFQSLWRTLTGGSIWPEMWESMEKQTEEGMKNILAAMQGGLGEVTPMVRATAGEAAAGPTTRNITINFTIQGVTDPDEVARQVENRLVEVLSRRSEVTAG